MFYHIEYSYTFRSQGTFFRETNQAIVHEFKLATFVYS